MKVTVSSKAFSAISLHAISHPFGAVHGVLIGTIASKKSVTVAHAVPVCHETPTKPLLDAALAIIQAKMPKGMAIVGWYTAPELVAEEPSFNPVALRVAANLNDEGILMIVDNQKLGSSLKGEKEASADQVLNAFGKDFGSQWKEPIPDVTVEDGAKTIQAVRQMQQSGGGGMKVLDFVDHLENEATSEWCTV
mmetsp:Transcript_21959/g.61149  ORF Transcript_21959/g.61149 Transcript_21959/m.61149 type:complete len:193 (-) Transcript_21959:287-865(-)